jgi:hypothetical protein
MTALVYPFTWLRYAPFWTPAALPVAVLTLVLVPYLSLVAFVVALLGAAAAVVVLAATVVAAPFLLARSIGRRRARIATTRSRAGAGLVERA